ncbi:MFS transporter [Nonomuraea jabiensis]|uniref:MFS transporter n=1 Tax=Nonomuraea jabiensis TaxID=882448 RepID=UPI0036917126
MTGTELTAVALPFAAMTVLGASPLHISLLAACGFLPHLVASLPVGALADRHRRRPLMIWCNVRQAVVLGPVPPAALLDGLGFVQLYAVAVVAALLSVVFDTAYQSYLPKLLRREQLAEGHGKLSVSMSFATVAGQSGAGALITAIGAARAVTVDAVSYLVSATTLALVRAEEPMPAARPAGARLRTKILEVLRYNRAEIRFARGDLQGAPADLSYVLELDPEFVAAYVNRSGIWAALGEHAEAKADALRGLELEPRNAYLPAALGQAEATLGRHEAARTAFRTSLDLDPEAATTWAGRAVLAYEMGDLDGAVADLTRAIQLEESPVFLFNRAVALRDLGEQESARSDLERAARLDPGDEDIRALLSAI